MRVVGCDLHAAKQRIAMLNRDSSSRRPWPATESRSGRMPSIVRALLALGLVLASIVAMPAQQRPTPQTFTTGTELVLVDFVVSDKADRPVSGLSATDFVVKEDGKERPIVSFEAFGGGSTPAPAGRNKEPVSPPHTALLPNASTVVLVDDGQLSPQQAARLRPSFGHLLDTMRTYYVLSYQPPRMTNRDTERSK